MSCGVTPQNRNDIYDFTIKMFIKDTFTMKIDLTAFVRMIKICTSKYFFLFLPHDLKKKHFNYFF